MRGSGGWKEPAHGGAEAVINVWVYQRFLSKGLKGLSTFSKYYVLLCGD